MTTTNKTIWKVGHILSRNGLIDAACQMRDISQAWSSDSTLSRANALELLDELYLKDNSIDHCLWDDLRKIVVQADQSGN